MRDPWTRWFVAAAIVAAAVLSSGCRETAEPLSTASSVTVVIIRSLDARTLSTAAASGLREIEERGAVALIARAPRSEGSLTQRLAARGVRIVDAGDAHLDARAAEATLRPVLASAAAGSAVVILAEPAGKRHGIVAVVSDGIAPGLLASASTHRAGIVLLGDVERMVAFLAGNQDVLSPVTVTPARDAVRRLSEMEAFFDAARTARPPLIVGFAAAGCLAVLGAWAVAIFDASPQRRRYWSAVSGRTLLLAISLPGGTLLARLLDPMPQTAPRTLVAAVGVTGVLWVAAMAMAERAGLRKAVVSAAALTVAVLVADQLTGGALAVAGAFSYQPLDGYRFYGIGNEGAAIAVGAWLLAVASARTGDGRLRKAAVLASAAAVIAVCALPVLGANSAVALWGTVTAGVFYAAAAHGGVRARDAAAIGVVVLAALMAVVVVERASGSQTHVGAALFASEGGLLAAAQERVAGVVRAYAAHPAALIGFAAWIVLAAVRFSPPQALARVLEAYPRVRAGLSAALAGGAVASFVEDSNVVVLVSLALYAGAALAVAALAAAHGQEV